MSAKHAWRDIYSTHAWDKILQNVTTAGTAGLVWHNYQIKALTLKIRLYHDIAKKKRRFKERIAALEEIQDICDQFVNRHKVQKTGPKMTRDGEGKHADFKSTKIDPWVLSLSRRCAKKIAYLNVLSEYYGYGLLKTHDCSPAAFTKYLSSKLQRYEKAKKSGPIPLYPGAQMEKFDPLHRGVELKLEQSDSGIEIEENSAWPMSRAVCQWLHDAQAKHTPFFIWLEDHPICTTTPGLDDAFNPSFNNAVTRIPYGADDLNFASVIVESKQLKARLVRDTDGPFTVFKTTDFAMVGGASAKMFGGAAFVWAGKDGLFSYMHCPAQIHHSTFRAGGPIECAGMWTVKDGLVTQLTNSSGHYKPGDVQIDRFKAYLDTEGVLSPTARIKVITK